MPFFKAFYVVIIKCNPLAFSSHSTAWVPSKPQTIFFLKKKRGSIMNILSYKKRIVGKYKMERKVASIWGWGWMEYSTLYLLPRSHHCIMSGSIINMHTYMQAQNIHLIKRNCQIGSLYEKYSNCKNSQNLRQICIKPNIKDLLSTKLNWNTLDSHLISLPIYKLCFAWNSL